MRPFVVIVLLISFGIPSVGQHPSNEVSKTLLYGHSEDGLLDFLQELLSASAKHDDRRVHELIQQSEIPDYRQWFLKTYQAGSAAGWADAYGRDLQRNERALQSSFAKFALTEGHFSVRKVVEKPGRRDMEWGMLHASKTPLDIYFAAWNPSSGESHAAQPIGYFIVIDGKFRWDSTVQFFTSTISSKQ